MPDRFHLAWPRRSRSRVVMDSLVLSVSSCVWSVSVVMALLLALVFVVGISTKCRTPPGEGGGSKRKLRYPHPCNGTTRSGKGEGSGGLHKRSAEDWGNGLRARGAGPSDLLLARRKGGNSQDGSFPICVDHPKTKSCCGKTSLSSEWFV
jgi:hypothetical protein